MPERALGADDVPSIITYGTNGFWTGAQIGLATGYLATGNDYESREWRKLVFGAGVGALSGVGIGITLGIVDAGARPPAMGWLILRDTGYGVGLGSLVGLATGALFMLDSPDTKYLVRGVAIGTLAGAALGVVAGVIQGISTDDDAAPASKSAFSWRLGVAGVADSDALLPALEGTF